MPLDSVSSSETYTAPSWNDEASLISLSEAPSLAEGLRAAREATGRNLDELAETTRIRRQFLEAIETGAYERLPSRPFSTGYVRAYARALGLDEEIAAERFKHEHPDAVAPLRAPVGSELDDVKPKSTPWVVGATVLISAVVLWNVARHAMIAPKQEAAGVRETVTAWRLGDTPGDPIRLAAPLPAPKDQTVPEPYLTPGIQDPTLNPAAPAGGEIIAASLTTTPEPAAPIGAAFNPRGAVYGAAPNASHVTFQARKPAAIVLRGADGVVYFARQLAAGEAYRAPLTGNVVVDVSDPLAFSVYYNGEYHGGLEATVTPLSQLNAQAAGAAAARVAAPAPASAAAPAVVAPGALPG